MGITREETNKPLTLEITLEEVALLQSLLKVETILQIRAEVGSQNDDNSKTEKIVLLFESFQDFEDRLLSLYQSIMEVSKANPQVTKHVMMIPMGVIKVYQMLCIETTKVKLPEIILKSFEKCGPNLLLKLNTALGEYSKDFKPPQSQSKEEDNLDFQINILGPKGIA